VQTARRKGHRNTSSIYIKYLHLRFCKRSVHLKISFSVPSTCGAFSAHPYSPHMSFLVTTVKLSSASGDLILRYSVNANTGN
jgi:hypothetical protein